MTQYKRRFLYNESFSSLTQQYITFTYTSLLSFRNPGPEGLWRSTHHKGNSMIERYNMYTQKSYNRSILYIQRLFSLSCSFLSMPTIFLLMYTVIIMCDVNAFEITFPFTIPIFTSCNVSLASSILYWISVFSLPCLSSIDFVSMSGANSCKSSPLESSSWKFLN